MVQILVVEDQVELLDSLSRGLREEGFSILSATTISVAEQLLKENDIEAILLDLMLPDRSGTSWLKELRRTGFSKPVVIITARDAVEDRIYGLNSGADDYLVKPFSFGELLARLRAVMRRSGTSSPTILQIANLEIDLLDRRVRRGGEELNLTLRQYELLVYLMKNAGEIVTREMIARDVWKESTATWTNVIEVQVNHLRRKIERSGWAPLLHTVRGEGYFMGERS